ncbi:MAG: hypothetical protein ACW99F_17295 [Candidatus Hodarchaeales archaeon]|jgi:hypothetical protein
MKFVTEDLSDEDLRWRSSDYSSPAPGWIVGHVLVTHEQIVNQLFLGNDSILPDKFYTVFGMNTEGNFPSSFDREELFQNYQKVNKNIVTDLMQKSDSWLEEFPNDEYFPPHWKNKNHMKVFVLHFNHVFAHSGQILELKRMVGKGAWGF